MAGSKCPFSMYEHHGPGKSGTAEIHPIETLGSGGGIAAVGHKDPFPAPGLSGHCRFGQQTFAGRGGKEEEAPKAVVPLGSTSARRSYGPANHGVYDVRAAFRDRSHV